MATILDTLDFNARSTQAALAASVGVATHLGYFIRGEHHNNGCTIIGFYIAAVLTFGVMLYRRLDLDILESIGRTLFLSASYFAGLYTSIGIYRSMFHPLRKFRGPFLAKFSNLYHSSLLVAKSDNYRVMTKMHKEYGPIIRTGPSNLSVNIPEAVQQVLGSKSICSKTPWYDTSLPLVNLHSTRDLKAHELRRKVFNRAFSPAALAEYDTRVSPISTLFCSQIEKMGNQPFNATAWFKYFAFDCMGELGFGESFHMLSSEENRWAPELVMAGMADIAWLQVIPWSTGILHRMPFLAGGPKRFIKFVEGEVAKRGKKKVTKHDIVSYLLAAYEKSEKKNPDYQWLRGDTRLVIVGGSDTTATSLIHIFYYLAKFPDQVRKLREELIPLLNGNEVLDAKDLAKAQHLNGVIHEALRLHPPIPSGYPRLTPPEGITINGTYIPGGTTIVIPLWAMGHSEECYERPEEFIPERWYSQPELIKHNVFASFGLGPFACIGRGLSLMEMRNLIIHILNHFDSIEFAPGEDGSSLMNDTKDHFIMEVPNLNLVFRKNKN